jgi:hypothetical protein
MSSRPWETRLKDLAQVLQNCHDTYFDPDLFRMQTNHFLQTSRTVTFIIQKNKAKIPDFDAWYRLNVLTPWAGDEVMTWAKDARNTIEKEGDLDMYSSLNLSLIFSYFPENDIDLVCTREELVSGGVKKLMSFAQQKLPTGISDGAVIRIQRRWVTASLSTWELLRALTYVYKQVYGCCVALAKHLGEDLRPGIVDPQEMSISREGAQGTIYQKMSSTSTHSMSSSRVVVDREKVQNLEKLMEITSELGEPSSFEEMFELHRRMVEFTFAEFGNHAQMLFLFDERWRPCSFLSTAFADTADKYVFWRHVNEQVRDLNAAGLAWISEAWMRRNPEDPSVPVRNMEIIGEQLHLVALARTGKQMECRWRIVRENEEKPPILETIPIEPSQWNFLVPIAKEFEIVGYVGDGATVTGA